MTKTHERVVTRPGNNGRNLIGSSCHYCELKIEDYPYFVKVGSKGRPRPYHLLCGVKAGFDVDSPGIPVATILSKK